ncbi:MAG: DUF4111 domain-containing protein [Clostridia bacterium]|nr:DUF4111 domain-containing protein [Clostridia bacterium]
MHYVMDEFIKRSEAILGDLLVGIYLHGSAVMGCFHPEKSDIDLIVVINHPMSDICKRAYMDMVVALNAAAPKKGIEMSVVLKEVCNPFVYPTPYELHFSITHLAWYRTNPEEYIQKMKGVDRDLAAHFTVILHRGRRLYGAPIHEIFGDVPKQYYFDSIWNDISDAPNEITENTMYVALNLPRVLAFQKEGSVLSKKEGGEWGIKTLPERYHALLMDALREYTQGADVCYNLELAKDYAEYMLDLIRRSIDDASQSASPSCGEIRERI